MTHASLPVGRQCPDLVAQGVRGVLQIRVACHDIVSGRSQAPIILNQALVDGEMTLGEKHVDEVTVEMIAEAGRSRLQRGFLETFRAAYEDRRLTKVMNIFVASFTQEPDSLSQWRAYSAQGGVTPSALPPSRCQARTSIT